MSLLALSNVDLIEVEKELASRSLAEFVKMAWHILEPSRKYVHNWHLDALCEHFEAVTSGDIKRLLLNVPPGSMKSLLSSVFWPAWEWGPMGLPGMRYVTASHEQGIAIRDARKMRILIQSEWYRERWPITLSGDQNAKLKFENSDTGFRHACAVSSMTGNPLNVEICSSPNSFSIKKETR